MNSEQIVSRMNSYLHTSAEVLTEWLGRVLPRTSTDWWEDSVLDSLSDSQREAVLQSGYSRLEDLDLGALLRIADRSWVTISQYVNLSVRERECIRDMMRVRNNWAHSGTALPGKDSIITDLTTLRDLYEQRECDQELVYSVEDMIEEVKSPTTIDFDDLAAAVPQQSQGVAAAYESEIGEKSMVYLVGDPSVRGIVMSITDVDGIKRYQCFVNGDIRTYYTGQIAPVVETPDYHWVDINTFKSYLAAYQINHPSGRELYSLHAARIDFVPYQFRPALKMIHAEEPRILIADSVGVGKTIEAGIIMKELQARGDLQRVMIICPKPLVSEHKWEDEMKRFDEDFTPVNGELMRQIISNTDRDGKWPEKYNRVIVPYSVLDSRTYGSIDDEEEMTGPGKRGRRKKRILGLMNLETPPQFDLVIVDEAHHIRNGSMEKEKAFNYKCVRYFCDHAKAVVMLTATPLQTSDMNLYTLLNVLRPDLVIDERTFELMARPNVYITTCAGIMRRAGENWQTEALEQLRLVLNTQWGENVIGPNPVYASIVQRLQQGEVSREERVQMISEVEGLHSFDSMLNRTRRKDIQDFCIRRPYTVAVEFTPAQQELYDAVLEFQRSALLELHEDAVSSIPFMMSMIKRQAASCIFGLAPHLRDLINYRFRQLEEDPEYEFDEDRGVQLSASGAKTLENMARYLLELADHLPAEDPKFDAMMQVIREKQEAENNKIIIFSTFRCTLAYLKRKLSAAGIRVEQVDGSVKDEDRRDLHDRFKMPRDDRDALDILLFSEVGTEGLDYQFCDMMINYDLPWNPMSIEQRIGRIDRRGQQSETVTICNVITNGTVDADIYYRCLMEIGVFEHSIGECEEILGEITEGIHEIAMDMSLTEAEQQYKLEQIADNKVRRIQEISRLEDQEQNFYGINLSEYITTQEIKRAENPWLTPRGLQTLVEEYLRSRLNMQRSPIMGEGGMKRLRLSYEDKGTLSADYESLGLSKSAVGWEWDSYLHDAARQWHDITFDASAANQGRDAFLITPMHPLAIQAARYYESKETSYIRVQYASDELRQGTYRFSVYAWNYKGLNEHFRLVVVCDDDEIAAELPDILQEAQTSAPAVRMDPSDWDSLEARQVALWQQSRQTAVQEAQTNASYRIESLTNNYRNRRRSIESKMRQTDNERILRMCNGQLDSESVKYEKAVADIRAHARTTDIHSTLIANGILEIV